MKKIMLICTVTLFFVACEKEPDPQSDNPTNPSDTMQVGPPMDGWIPNAVTDIDGNSYDAVRIGDQVWMAQNLRTTRFANGDAIPEESTSSYTDPYRYAPCTDVENYGYLYNWPAFMHGVSSTSSNPSSVQGICPTGWHVPSEAEWVQLTDFVSGQDTFVCNPGYTHTIAKALASSIGWETYSGSCAVGNDPESNNATGFSALPAGYWFGDGSGFGAMGQEAWFWTATEHSNNQYSAIRGMGYRGTNVSGGYSDKCDGYSVRCVKD